MRHIMRAAACLLSVILSISLCVAPQIAAEDDPPQQAHVVESSGDGYALYNGLKLPSLPEWDKEKYPYAVLYGDNPRLYLSTVPYLEYDGRVAAGGSTVSGMRTIYNLEENCWNVTVSVDVTNATLGRLVNPSSIVWSNHDILSESDNSVFFAASDPIHLDGMKVIEWDGVIDGLQLKAKRYLVSTALDVDLTREYVSVLLENLATFSVYQGSFSWNESVDGYSFGYQCVFVPESGEYFSEAGIWLHQANYETRTTPLFAYYPLPATVDYTLTYSTTQGTAPADRVVTVNVGESYLLSAEDLPTLAAPGYVHTGWLLNGIQAAVGDPVTGDVLLTASWEEIILPPDDPVEPEPPETFWDAFGALIQSIVDLMQIEFTLWGFSFSFWHVMLFGIFVLIAGKFVGGFFND